MGAAEGLMAEIAAKGANRGEAKRYPVMLCVALELYLVDAENLGYLRFVAGAMLVRVWSALRFDDTKSIGPAAVEDFDQYYRFTLERTKSTGPGRKRQLVYAYLSKHAFFVVPGWLTTFVNMLSHGPFAYARDYLVPLPSVGLDGVMQAMADVSDMMAVERTLLEALRAPAFIRKAGGVPWRCSPKALLPSGVGDY